MSLSGAGDVIQVNSAHFAIADGTKSLRTKTLLLSNVNAAGVPTIVADGSNVYSSSNIKTGTFFIGDGGIISNITGASEGAYGGADAAVANVVIDATGRIKSIVTRNMTLSNVVDNEAGANVTSNTIQFTNSNVSISASGNVEAIGKYVKAGYFVGDGAGLTNMTDASEGDYGDFETIPIVSVNGSGRIDSITPVAARKDTLSNVVARGASTANVMTFSNAGQAVVVTSSAGRVGIANSTPAHSLSVGTKFYVANAATAATLGNVVTVTGNVSATHFHGNAKYLTKTTDATDQTWGGVGNVAAITVANGRITEISNVAIPTDLASVTAQGNTTSDIVSFTNATSLVTEGKVGISNSAPDHTLAVGDNFYVGSDGATVAEYFSGDGANVTNIVGSSVVATHGSASSVPIIQIGSGGKITSISNTSIAQTLQAVTDVASGNTTTNTVEFNNTGVSLVALGKTGLGGNTTPAHELSVGNNVYVDDDGTNKVVVTGRVSATDYVGDGGLLSNLSDFNASSGSSGSFGSASQVPIITFDNNGRISGMTTAEVRSNVTSVSGAGDNAGKYISYYSDDNTVTSSSGATFDPSTGNMEISGAFTAGGDLQVGGNLHVTGNVYHSENLVVDDNLIEIGNAAATTKTLGTLLSRSDGNVAIAYLNTDHASYADTLIFAKTDASGASSVIDPLTAHLDAKFFGNLTVQNNFTIGSASKFFFDTDNQNLTVGGTITAGTFAGSGAGLSAIQLSNISDNFETNFTSNVSRIGDLETSNGLVWSNITTIISDVSSNAGILSTLKTDHEDNVTRINTLITDLDAAEVDIDNLETSNGLAWSNISTIISDVSSNAGILSTLKTDHEDNVTRINTLVTKTTDISFSGITTTIAQDVVIGAASQFFFDESTSKLGISNSSAPHSLTVGENFFVDTTNDIVSTIGSNLHTGSIEVVGDTSTIEFKTSITEDNGDCKIAKSSDGLVFSTGGDGSLTTAVTMHGDTQNVTFSNSITVTNNVVTNALVFNGTASIQAAQISLDDVLAVSNSTTRDIITTGNVNTSNLLATGTKNFNIKHPIVEGKRLQHACIETARADNVYMGSVVLVNGKAEVDLDLANKMTAGTFVALNKDIRVFTTNESDWDAVKGRVEDSTLRIECQNGVSNAKVSWLVAGTRKDIADLVVEV